MSQKYLIAVITLVIGLFGGYLLGANSHQSMFAGMSRHMGSDLVSDSAEFDLQFIDAMIVHHQDAVDMAEVALQNSQREEIRNLSNQIISAQSSEIEMMRQWRSEWYGR